MRGIELYDRIVDLAGQSAITQLFYAGVVLVVAAALLLSIGRARWFARGLGIVGVLCFMLAMFLIHEQKVVERKDDRVTVTHWRYSPAVRFQVRVALLGLPAAAAFLMMQILWTTQRRQRSTVPTLLRDGRVKLVRGDVDGALEAFDEALDISPYLGEAYHLRATAQRARGRADEALADLDDAIRCDPQIAAAYLLRGRILAERGEYEPAARDLDHYMGMRPTDVEGYLHRGLCRSAQGRVVEAVADLQRVLKLTNHSDFADPARAELDRLYARLPEGEETEALPPGPDVPLKSVLDSLPRYDEAPLGEPRPLEAPRPATLPDLSAPAGERTPPPA